MTKFLDAFGVRLYTGFMKNVWLFVGLLVLLVGCGGQETAVPPTPEEVVQYAADRLQQLTGFAFTIDQSGAPAYVDPTGVVAFKEAAGYFVAPDKSQAVVKVAAPGLVTEVQVVNIGAAQWQTNIVTGQWESLPPGSGFNPGALFDANTGLAAILRQDLSDVAFGSTEEQGSATELEKGLLLVTATAAADKLYAITGGLIGPEPVDVALWVEPNSWEIRRIIVIEPAAEKNPPSVWKVDFTEYDTVVEIVPPG